MPRSWLVFEQDRRQKIRSSETCRFLREWSMIGTFADPGWWRSVFDGPLLHDARKLARRERSRCRSYSRGGRNLLAGVAQGVEFA